MAIKFKILAVVSFVLVASFLLGWYLVNINISLIVESESSMVNDEMLSKWQTESKAVFTRYYKLVDIYKDLAVREAAMLVNDQNVLDAYAIANKGDLENENDPASKKARAILKKTFESKLQGLDKFGNIENYKIHFHTKNVRSLARIWRRGWQTHRDGIEVDITDDISAFRDTIRMVKETNEAVSGIEVGRGGFVLRGICPINSPGGEYLGSVEFLMPLSEVTRSLSAGKNVNHAVYMPKRFLEIAENLRDSEQYPVVEDSFVRVSSTNDSLFSSIVDGIMLERFWHKPESVIIDNKYISAMPIRDYKGLNIGMFIVLLNTEDDIQQNMKIRSSVRKKLYKFKVAFAIVVFLTLFVVLEVIYLFLSRILLKLEEASNELIESEEKFRSLFTCMLDGFALHEIILDENNQPCDYRFLMVNPAFENIMNCRSEDIIGKSVLQLLPNLKKSWIENYGKVALTQEAKRFEDYSEALGKYFDIYSFSPKFGQFACVCRDITLAKKAEEEKLAMQEEVLYSEKMRVVGQLAGGVAHDINNALGGIIGSAEILKNRISNQENMHFVDMILSSAEKAAVITMNLLTFSRKNFMPYHDVDIKQVLKESLSLVSKKFGDRISIVESYAADIMIVRGDHTQLFSSFVNICVNGCEAMRDGGELEVVAEKIYLSEEDVLDRSNNLCSGEYLKIVFRDSGVGINEEDLSRVYEPFFSTKDFGGGLGLSAVLGTVENHKGWIDIKSKIGVGTSVTVLLPCID